MAMNAIQEEIAKVIEAEGLTLNSASEDPLTDMHQLNDAIDNKIKAPRGYIDGFEMYSYTNTILRMNRGVALDEAGAKWIRKTTDFEKYVCHGGSLDVWVAGGGNGSVLSADTVWWNTVVGQWTGGTNSITGISSTAGMRVGDLISCGNTAAFGYAWARITLVGPTSITLDKNLPANGVSQTLANRGRWFHVWAIGKSVDPAAFDVVLTTDIDALSGAGFGAFDIYRRLGSVWVGNVAGNPTLADFNQNGDNFYWAAENPRTIDAQPIGGTTAAGDKTGKSLTPRQVNTRARVLVTGIITGGQSGKALKVIPRDASHGNTTVRGEYYFNAYNTGSFVQTFELEVNTGLNSDVILNCEGGSSSLAAVVLYLTTMSWVDRRGKR